MMFAEIKAALFTVKAAAIAAGVVAVIGLFTWNQIHQYQKGYRAALADVRSQNIKAKGQVDAGFKDIENCDNRGGTWDSSSGLCQ